ncbi:hypothetical protein AB0J55_34865 [Amycolatopsis sp. NPDC049688]|uniref:hypothetical protein n=1 Tax=Amycolatopsis sp. NPDC049688 TaxID=3154733 RepID=UPI00341BF18C
MHQVATELGICVALAILFSLVNILVFLSLRRLLFAFFAKKKYRSDLHGTALGGGAAEIAVVTWVLVASVFASMVVVLVGGSVGQSTGSPVAGCVVAVVVLLSYGLLVMVMWAQVEQAVIGAENGEWEDAFMAPPRPVVILLADKFFRCWCLRASVLLGSFEAALIRFFVVSDPRAPVSEAMSFWLSITVFASIALVKYAVTVSWRVHSYRKFELFVMEKAIEGAMRAGFEELDRLRRLRKPESRHIHGNQESFSYALFRPGDWRGEAHARASRVAQVLVRCSRRFDRRFPKGQSMKIELAGRMLAAQLLENVVQSMERQELVMRKFLPYAAALLWHRDPVCVSEEIHSRFAADSVDVDFASLSFRGAIEVFNDSVRITGPLLKFFGILAVIAITVSAGNFSGLVEFVKKLLGG